LRCFAGDCCTHKMKSVYRLAADEKIKMIVPVAVF